MISSLHHKTSASFVEPFTPFHLLNDPEEIIPVGVKYEEGKRGPKIPIQPHTVGFRPTYMNSHQSASEVFFRVFDNLSSQQMPPPKVESFLREGSQQGLVNDKPAKRPYKKRQGRLVLKLKRESSETTEDAVQLSSEPAQKKRGRKMKDSLPETAKSTKKSKSDSGKKRGLSPEETEAYHKRRLKELERDVNDPILNTSPQRKRGTTAPRKKKAASETESTQAKTKNGGCWTCRIRHKSCPQDGERCSTCVRLGLFCDQSPTRPKYMMNKESCKRIKRDIKEITDSSRSRSAQQRKKESGTPLRSPSVKQE